MTRRQIHAGLLIVGLAWCITAIMNWQMDWLNRSDLYMGGLLIIALGLHGLWKTDPR